LSHDDRHVAAGSQELCANRARVGPVVDHRKAIEQKIAGQEIERVEVEARPPTTDLVATLKASLGRKALAKAPPPTMAERKPTPARRPARGHRAS
jgi:hypothetical protein